MAKKTREEILAEDERRSRWGKWFTAQFIELMRQQGRTLTIGELAEILGETRANCEKWLPGLAIPGARSTINIANKLQTLEIYDVLDIPRPAIIDDATRPIDLLINRDTLDKLRRDDPEKFRQLQDELAAVDDDHSRKKGKPVTVAAQLF